ncbi:MAG TPA: hypothetical protein PKA63_02650 [Oligoflexia bacterium]|nr:hypothetical protein [Oligoflexia bacterium]HMP47552.1 hypothetical protein [Oligoflexia bacterium]
MRLSKFIIPSLLFLASACNEYWWTRGQPPATSDILSRASSRVIEMEDSSKWNRSDISSHAKTISSGLAESLVSGDKNKAREEFLALEQTLLSLEGKLSYGNRAPFNELSGQFRSFKKRISSEGFENIPDESVKLFTARVLFLLASEMNVPAPDKVNGIS